MKILNASQAREMDRHTIEDLGVPSLELMERAGSAVTKVILERYPGAQRVLVVCGRGNNGGDGWVVARKLVEAGKTVTVVTHWPKEECSGDCREMWTRAGSVSVTKAVDTLDYDVLVDAVYGTGYDPARSGYDSGLECLWDNPVRPPVVSVDVPSGLEATTGRVGERSVTADITVTFQNPKLGMFLGEGRGACGELVVADIGLVEQAGLDGAPEYVTDAGLARLSPGAHKRDRGSVLCVGGSTVMPGSIALTAYAALRAGAGLATCAVPDSIQPIVAGYFPEVMTLPLPDGGMGCLTPQAAESLLPLLERYRVLAFGPGLTAQAPVREAVRILIERCPIPIILDADGLNCLSELGPLTHSAPLVLTPHAGEMGRLLGMGPEEVENDRFTAAKEASMKFGATVVLKGRHTVTSDETGLAVNATGNVGMATAGSGDVLTGAIAALGLDRLRAAVFMHGLAGDTCLREIGLGFTAMDIARALPQAGSTLTRGAGGLR